MDFLEEDIEVLEEYGRKDLAESLRKLFGNSVVKKICEKKIFVK